jgi:putative toxin-antitoxin system antitoxin component (TIGR02293 family)
MSELSWIFQHLGGKRVVGKSAWKSTLDLHHSIVSGLPVGCVIYFKKHTGLSNINMSKALGVSEKTFIRWQDDPEKLLDPVFSDRLVRTAKVMGLAEEVLEDAKNARAWLSKAQSALGNEIPQELLRTDIGAKQVEDVLLRMEHGYLA